MKINGILIRIGITLAIYTYFYLSGIFILMLTNSSSDLLTNIFSVQAFAIIPVIGIFSGSIIFLTILCLYWFFDWIVNGDDL